MKRIDLRLILVSSAAALSLSTAGAELAAALTGGSLSIPVSAILTGGNVSTGGSLRNISAIGGHGTAMSGGTMSLIPGALASIKTARPDTSEAHAYPTPFMPSKGHDRVTFTQLPAFATIRVFTLSGRLVRSLEKNDSTDSLIWSPVVNEQGTPLASGVYLFTVIQPGVSKRRGKIMVIK